MEFIKPGNERELILLNMVLYIDTTNFNKVTYAVVPPSLPLRGRVRERVRKKSYKIDPHKSFEILQKLEEFLKTNKYPVSSIQYLVCNKGPGSYTGTRVGAAHALAISLALNIPIKALSKEKFEKELKNNTLMQR